ncbi:5'-AMP-activated protein kinase beta subunit, interation domain-containing protein [Cantharellus anzutake]|uniref:5'-AMP-activated protein kinase beta subunit, interation domain-containing protein n=1 Tax=Cantharellus anzutake TaxID=1750568 RepID=UPI001904B764|nr:5'-AMP-activated protein kinase beta subunit, interation domain-containing protein [Cantharellus anzutake]KAF8333563.1 5'-AMP-activated protein kinase beta subunit, interation domain-containing protein [Cantharellus anzutake]
MGTSQSSPFQPEGNDGLVQTTITWRGGGTNVFLSGTFESSWKGRVRMIPESSPGVFSVAIRLPPGNHRLKFLVDDQWRCSDELPTATDNDGHLVNYIEVPPSAWDPSETASSRTSRQQTPFISHIPPHLVHSAVQEERYLSQQLADPPPIPHPATLPRHLEKVILNAQRHGRDRAVMEGSRDDNSVLPIPNHVVLNHLGTSAIKNGVLAVATTMRYHKKYISTLYFKPA